ncbi:MAG: hypothetical protein JXA69_04870 [Phycisphaerae bacterium]|nr:hypothetical protein [Phycisphaerae bacterium]
MSLEPPAPPVDNEDALETPQLAPDSQGGDLPRYAIALTAALTGALMIGLLLNAPPAMCPNDNARWNAVWAMIETGRCSWVHEEKGWPLFTIDRCTYDVIETEADKQAARWYSAKPPLMQVILAGIAWPICRVFGLDFRYDFAIVGRTILILVNAVPLMVYLALFGRMLLALGTRGFALVFCLLAAAVGTYVTGWCITLNNHVLGAFCCFFSIYGLYAVSRRPGEVKWPAYAAAGFFAAMAVTFETPAAALLGLTAMYAFYLNRGRTLRIFLPAAIIPIAAFFIANKLCIGRWTPFQWTHPAHYDPYWIKPSGIDGLSEPWHIYLFHMTFGHHGFFSLTPIFLISLVGIVRHLRDRASTLRGFAASTLVASTAVVTFYAIKSNNYAGTCQGLRWLFWLTPMWLLMLPAGIGWLSHRVTGRAIAIAFLTISTFSMAYAMRMPWSRSWLHDLFYKTGITAY